MAWSPDIDQCRGIRNALREDQLMRLRYITVAALLAVALMTAPAAAISAAEKMDICKFGADDQKLAGAKRKSFIAKCMANVPPARATAKPKK
jgi:hypothetical protein